jgi:hypothetical protein
MRSVGLIVARLMSRIRMQATKTTARTWAAVAATGMRARIDI